jgi:HNH endonuclease
MPSDWKPEQRIKDPDLLARFRLEHAGEPCEICEKRIGTDPHHKRFRSQSGDDVDENLIWLCRSCHDDIHSGRISRYDF